MNNLKRESRWGRMLGLFLAVGFLATLALPGGAAWAVKTGGSITVGIDTDAKGWDPHLATAFTSFSFYEHVYECPIRYDAKGKIIPSLASSWETPNDKTVIFNVRKGVKFHNGREMTGEDFKYSYMRLKDPKQSQYPSEWLALETVDVLGKYKVRFNLNRPDPIMLRNMAQCRFAAIVPREVVEKHGNLTAVQVGTGPWKVKQYVPGDYTIFEKFEDYWDKGYPRLDRMKFQVIKDEISRLSAVRKGSMEVTWVKEAHMAAGAKKTKGLRVYSPPPARQGRIFFNVKKPPFNNKKLRQAVAAAVDWQALVDNILFGFGTKTASVPPAAAPYALPQDEVEKLPFKNRNLKLSRKLLKEAGHPNGFSFTLLTSEHGPDYTSTAQIVQSNLKDAGIKVKLEVAEWGIHLKRWRACEHQASYIGGVWKADPDLYLRAYVHGSKAKKFCGYKNPEVDRLMDEARVMVDIPKRVKVWHRIQRLLAEDVPVLFTMVGPPRFEITRDFIKDYDFMPQISRFNLKYAWLDK
jgi:peptide/nickel transport system substrate-binding protein